MRFLEAKVPPPLVGLVVAAITWAIAPLGPRLPLPPFVRATAALVLCAAGLAVMVAGVMSFRRAATTVNPLRPETSTALVSTGVYSFTRNPMYLGMSLVFLGWAVHLSSLVAFLGPVGFALYITRFQIVPEERALERLFGADFAAYTRRVRRWL